MSVVTSVGGHKCRWSQVSVITIVVVTIVVVTSVVVTKRSWSQMSVVRSVAEPFVSSEKDVYVSRIVIRL